jgi:phosphate transport system substrate-binding protein
MKRYIYSILISLAFIFTACSDNNPIAKFIQPKEPKDSTINTLFTQDDPSLPSVKNKSSKKNRNKLSNSSLKHELSTTKKPVAQLKSNSKEGIQLPEVKPIDVEGNMIIAGSSTVFPLIEILYQRFIEEGYSGTIKLESVNSEKGFKLFCKQGEIDIANASRPIKDEEIKHCAAINRKPIAFRVGTDTLAVVVNPENDFLTNVTKKELAAIFTAQQWSDVNPKWPNVPIQRFIPSRDSGTLDFFVEEVFAQNAEPILAAPNAQFSADDEELVQGVSRNKYAIGFLGYAFYREHTKALKIVSIANIEPSVTTIEDGKYPLARPLFIYSDANIIKKKPQVAAFINFFLTNVNQEIGRVGYFPVSQTVLNEAKLQWLKAVGSEAWLKQQSNN